MDFNFKLLFQAAYRALFKAGGTNARLTPRRIFFLLLAAVMYCATELCNWTGFLLDNIFFSAYRRQKVLKPVFIIGVPRSGTTHLQRLLALDEARFTSMKFWEILFAPSVTQKLFFKALGELDSCCGSPFYRLVRALEKSLFKNIRVFHPFSLFEADEDNMVMLHIFSSAAAFLVLPFQDVLLPYFLFDQELDAERRARVMKFYKRCVQNHLYVFGKDKQFLSKNPMFSTHVQSLNETFPDAKFICMARTPFETVPSTISMFSYYFNALMSPVEPHPFADRLLDILQLFYEYPLAKLAEQPADRQQIIDYTTLVEKPEQTVTELFARFGIELSPAYARALKKEQEKARSYKSSHAYSLENFGLTPETIVKKYESVFNRFGFDLKP